MSLGNNIKNARKALDLSQAQLAERIGVSDQAVSLWERGDAVPETEHLICLAEKLGLTVNDLAYDREAPGWELKSPYCDHDRMYTRVRSEAHARGWIQTEKALPFMRERHTGQVRDGIACEPYEVHPLTLACRLMAMHVHDDDLIAAALLHDTVEDTGAEPEELPVNDRARELVCLLSYNTYPGEKDKIKPLYYANIAKDPAAALIKCADRCHNLSTMADGEDRERLAVYVRETERYVYPLLEVIRQDPAYDDAAWLLKDQIVSLTETLKRLL